MGAEVDELTLAARERRAASCSTRVPTATKVLAVGFLLVAVPLAGLTHSDRGVSLPLLGFLVVAYAGASLVEFEVGAGSAVPTQVLLVPMLFLLPTGWVPLAAAGGFVLGDCASGLFHRRSCGNPLVLIGSSWYAIGPAMVLLLAGEAPFAVSRWPLYLLAFTAQFAGDAISTAIADGRSFRTRASLSVRVLVSVYAVDALLTPIGLGFAALAQHDRVALVLPLCLPALLLLFARSHRLHLDSLVALRDAYHGTAVVLGDVIESDDGYTGEHSRDVQALCLAVADRLGLDPMQRREVEFTALLHDVGKLRIPNEIITKPGALSAEERAVINTHTIEGERLLAGVGGFLSHVGQLVRSCHERHDGRGYPDGLSGEEIPLAARIVACCDAYHAMTSDRSYRPAMPKPLALAELQAGAGSQFDPVVVEALLTTLDAPAVVRPEHEPALGSGAQAAASALQSAAHRGSGAGSSPPGQAPTAVGEIVRERVSIERLRARSRVAPALSAYLPGGAFALVALALPFILGVTVDLRTIAIFAALTATYALAFGIQFEIGPGSAVPTQLAFVPMLVFLPLALVPLAVGIAILARAAWDPDSCSCPPRQRPFVLLLGGLCTLGPVALLLATGGVLTWPLLVAVLAAQIAIDSIVNFLRVSLALGYPVPALARGLAWSFLVDVALAPGAFAVVAPQHAGAAGAAVAVAGLLGFLGLLASGRQRLLSQAVNLADAYREAAERARCDALTGLTNRLGWDEAVTSVDTGRPVGVIMLDVNHLKHANDTRGHRFGDQLLAEVAATLRAHTPHAEIVARLGGDEFAVLLLGDNANTAGYTAEQLRHAFATHPGLEGHPVSAAIGHATGTPGSSIQATIEAADQAVYLDKPAVPRLVALASPTTARPQPHAQPEIRSA